MFAGRYFPGHYFAPHYFPGTGEGDIPADGDGWSEPARGVHFREHGQERLGTGFGEASAAHTGTTFRRRNR